jgi:hypothetical protein
MYASTIGIIVRQWATSSRLQSQTNPQLSEACAWLGDQWPVAMTMVGRLRSHGSQATAHQMRAVLSTVLHGVSAESLGTDASSPTSLPTSQELHSRLLAGNAWESEVAEVGHARLDREWISTRCNAS